jgi:hypothetical protein
MASGAMAAPPAPAPEARSAPPSAQREPRGSTPVDGERLAVPNADPVGCVLYGRVLDATGGSLAGKKIVVWLEDTAGMRVHASMTPSADYSATGFQGGPWLVNAYSVGYRASRASLDLAPESVVRHDITLEPAAKLRVKLTAPDGIPLREALLRIGTRTGNLIPVATAEPPGAMIDGVLGNNHVGVGEFWQSGYVFEPLPPEYLGFLVLDAEPPVHVSIVLLGAVLATQRVERGAAEVAFVVAPEAVLAARGTLRCRVVDGGTGAPFEGAEIRLTDMGGSQAFPLSRTDVEGVAVLAGLDPGRYQLTVGAPGRADMQREVALLPGQTLELEALALVQETWIAGRLVDAAGAPAEGTIEVGRVEADGKLVLVRQLARTEHGAFRIGKLPPGAYVVRSAAREGRPYKAQPTAATSNQRVSTLGGSVENLELAVLPLGRLVLLYERADWQTLRYSVLDAQGLERAGGRLWNTVQQSEALPHGDYRLVVADAEGKTLLDRAVALGEEPVAIELPRE